MINQVKKAKRLFEYHKEKETPLELLDAALKKLQHQNMVTDGIKIADIPKAMELTKQIKNLADELESEFYHYMKDVKKLKDKYK